MIEIIKEKNIKSFLKTLSFRNNQELYNINTTVKEIINNVKNGGDNAVKMYCKKFDNVELENFIVRQEEINEAFKAVDKEIINALEESKKNIISYHQLQKNRGYLYTKGNGVYMGQRIIPLEKVGVYVPGGKAAYPSSVLMNVIPAKVAGVKEIIMVTPPNKDGKIKDIILVAAKIAGVNKIFKVGGAQAIAALAYGTESIPKVLKIVGPGNAYVAEAKKEVFGQVAIDMIAGPSEVLIIADEKANAKYIAADLMSQAEHDERASSILLTTSEALAKEVIKEIENQIKTLSKKDIIIKSLRRYGKIVICDSIEKAIKIANEIAPEHLELLLDNPMEYLDDIKNAASVFLGEYTPEPVGDYFGGTNHVLPTGGTAKFSSPLSVDDFVKKSSYLHYSKEAFYRDGRKIVKIADSEGLTAHSNSILVRGKHEEDK